jgi:hypothetical protein
MEEKRDSLGYGGYVALTSSPSSSSSQNAHTHTHTLFLHTVAAPPLVNLLQPPSPLLAPLKPGISRALVPGTGSGYECVELAKAGWNVLGIDLAPTAIARAQQLLQEKEKEEGQNKEAWQGKVEYRVADFFEVEGRFDVIFDYTVCRMQGCVCVCVCLCGERVDGCGGRAERFTKETLSSHI